MVAEQDTASAGRGELGGGARPGVDVPPNGGRRSIGGASTTIPAISPCQYVRDRKPDGGWGWMVTFGVFLVFVITTGSSWAFGILYIAFLDAFHQSKAITAIPGSLIFMTMVMTNPYAGLLATKYGHRPVIFIGGVVSSLAIFACSFATDFTMLTVTYGLIGGVGFGLSHMPAVVMLSHYFDTKIGTATGIAMSGTGLGTIFMSVVTQYLVAEFGWRGTMLILSAINANLCFAAAVMRPVKLQLRPRTPSEEGALVMSAQGVTRTTFKSDDVIYKKIPLNDDSADETHFVITANPLHERQGQNGVALRTRPPASLENEHTGAAHPHLNSYTKMDTMSNNPQVGAPPNDACVTKSIEAEADNIVPQTSCSLRKLWRRLVAFLDSVYGFALWKTPLYLSFLLGINLAFFGMTVVSAHVAKRALELGIHHIHSSSLVAVLGLSQAAGRLLTGPIVDRCRLNPLQLYQAMTATCGIGIVASIYLPSFPGQVAFCTVAGYTTGACATLQTVMCVSLFGPGQIKYAYPGVILAVGIAMLTSPPIAGLCRDVQGTYVGAFFMAAAACFSSVVAHIPLSCTIKPGKKTARPPIEVIPMELDELASQV